MPISAAGNSQSLFKSAGSADDGFTPLRHFAEHGFTPLRHSAEHGFTLVELMVVVTVIGLTAGVAMWSLPDPRGRVVEEAARFAARARAAHDLAIIEARPVSLWVTGGGYGFDGRTGGRWVPIADKPLRVERWAEGTAARLAQPQVRVTFDPTGLADRSAEVRLDRDGREVGVLIGADGSVRVDG